MHSTRQKPKDRSESPRLASDTQIYS